MRKHLFLYLAIACFLSLLAIFVADGYMGIYDTLEVTADELTRIIELDQWDNNRYEPSMRAEWSSKVFFTYIVENHRFTGYTTAVSASVWKENEKLLDLFSQEKAAGPFDSLSAEWILDSKELESLGFSSEQYTVKIERDSAERIVLVRFNTPRIAPPIEPRPVPE